MQQKESAKPSRNVHSGKPELRHDQESFHPKTSLLLSATGSLELRLVSPAILEHTNNNTSHSWLGLVIASNDRRTRLYLIKYFEISVPRHIRFAKLRKNKSRITTFHKECKLTPELEIYWTYCGKEEKSSSPFSTIFCYLLLDFYVKT